MALRDLQPRWHLDGHDFLIAQPAKRGRMIFSAAGIA
jgi:hypothetical protein